MRRATLFLLLSPLCAASLVARYAAGAPATSDTTVRGGSAALVEVYSTPGCRYCAKAKGLLRRRGVAFQEVDVSRSDDNLKTMMQRAGRSTLPQIFVGGEHLGGCSELLAESEEGSLAERLRRIGVTLLDVLDEEAEAEAEAVLDAVAEPCAPCDAAERVERAGELNPPIMSASTPQRSAVELATEMQRTMLELLDEHALEDGCDVVALVSSAGFAAYCDLAGGLCAIDEQEVLGPRASADERRCFWINLYNALCLHATAVLGAPADADQRVTFFSGASGAKYRVGKLSFSLDDMEHGVLRCNRAGPGAADAAPPFGADDPRLPLALPDADFDPRIHFALNCGASSCPPIKLYRPDTLEASLALATQAFLEADLEVDRPRRELTCSRILDWYGADFGATDRAKLLRLRGLLPRGRPLHAELGELVGDLEGGQGPSFVYRTYDWRSVL